MNAEMRQCVKVYLSTGATGGDGKGLASSRLRLQLRRAREVLKLGHFPVGQSIRVGSCRNIRRHHEI